MSVMTPIVGADVSSPVNDPPIFLLYQQQSLLLLLLLLQSQRLCAFLHPSRKPAQYASLFTCSQLSTASLSLHSQLFPQVFPQVFPELFPQVFPQVFPQLFPELFPQLLPHLFLQVLLHGLNKQLIFCTSHINIQCIIWSV